MKKGTIGNGSLFFVFSFLFKNQNTVFVLITYLNDSSGNYDGNDLSNINESILIFCLDPRDKKEIMQLLGITVQTKNFNTHILPLIRLGLIAMTIPDKLRSKKQKYKTTVKGKEILEMRNPK